MAGKPRRWIVSFLSGAFASAILLGWYVLRSSHNYSELGTFYQGTVAGQQVLGVAFVEYDGLGFLELTQWKVELVRSPGQHVTLYRKSSVFQEKIPHQPKIEINGRQIHIDDGEDQIEVTVQESPKN